MGSWNPGPRSLANVGSQALPGLHRLYAGLDKNSHHVSSFLTWLVGKCCPCIGLELNSRGIWWQWSVWTLGAKLYLFNQFCHDLSLASQMNQWGHLNFSTCFSKISRWDQVFSNFKAISALILITSLHTQARQVLPTKETESRIWILNLIMLYPCEARSHTLLRVWLNQPIARTVGWGSCYAPWYPNLVERI